MVWKHIAPFKGAHIRVRRPWLYTHHGIYVSDNEVIGWTAEPGQIFDAKIAKVTLAEFAQGDTVEVKVGGYKYPPDLIVTRARNRVGTENSEPYNLALNNCEHFANWCISGNSYSSQVDKAMIFLGATVLGVGKKFLKEEGYEDSTSEEEIIMTNENDLSSMVKTEATLKENQENVKKNNKNKFKEKESHDEGLKYNPFKGLKLQK